MNRGKLAVLSILLLGVVLAGFALWWNIASGHRALEFWGNAAAQRIIRGEAEVELLWLTPAEDDSDPERLAISGRTYQVIAGADVRAARGLIHARHALLEDASYDWEKRDSSSAADCTLAVRFRDASGTTTVAFDFDKRLIAHVESGRQQAAVEKIVDGWQSFADRHAPASDRPEPQ